MIQIDLPLFHCRNPHTHMNTWTKTIIVIQFYYVYVAIFKIQTLNSQFKIHNGDEIIIIGNGKFWQNDKNNVMLLALKLWKEWKLRWINVNNFAEFSSLNYLSYIHKTHSLSRMNWGLYETELSILKCV